jgi:MFS family permease
MQGILTGCLSFTGGFGAFWSSYLIKYRTRKQCFMDLALAMIVVCVLLQVQNLWVLLIARCLQGMTIGMITAVVPMYIK